MYKLHMSTQEIIEALKYVEGPDRELDDRIWRWCNENKIGVVGWRYDLDEAPAYTSSLDAAVTLLPKDETAIGGCADFIIEHVNGGLTICARVGHNDPDKISFAGTDAAALSAAAILAHQMFGILS